MPGRSTPRRWRVRLVGIVVALALAAGACTGGTEHAIDRSAAATTRPPPTTVAPTTTTAPADITGTPSPGNVDHSGFEWYTHPSSNGAHELIGVRRQPTPGPHPAVLLVHSSAGLNVDYVTFADELAERGFDVAVGCWFASVDVTDPENVTIPCADAPPFKGVVDAAVPDLDSLVEAAHHALGASEPLTLVGFSRGAGIAALRASAGRPEPVVLVAGMYEGWNGLGSTVPGGEVDVVQRVDGWSAPALILHGALDRAVPISQAHHLEEALRARGVDVEGRYYADGGHNLGADPAAVDLRDRIAQFVCAHAGCPLP
jgi:alpha-beta hydrolase superfamily lysophospholipase